MESDLAARDLGTENLKASPAKSRVIVSGKAVTTVVDSRGSGALKLGKSLSEVESRHRQPRYSLEELMEQNAEADEYLMQFLPDLMRSTWSTHVPILLPQLQISLQSKVSGAAKKLLKSARSIAQESALATAEVPKPSTTRAKSGKFPQRELLVLAHLSMHSTDSVTAARLVETVLLFLGDVQRGFAQLHNRSRSKRERARETSGNYYF